MENKELAYKERLSIRPMLKRKSVFIISSFLSISIIGLCTFSGWHSFRRHSILQKRMQDVRMLTITYFESAKTNEPNNISELISTLNSKHIILNNPIPKDRSFDCYRLVYLGTNNNCITPNTVLIEETTNVNDDKSIIKSYMDGSIVVLERKLYK
jgi:hypothetical protein